MPRRKPALTFPDTRPSTSAATRFDLKRLFEEMDRRRSLIEEHFLRREVVREEALRRDDPDSWRQRESGRLARNREQAELNRKLRAAGCRPVSSELSLELKMKKLQQLESRNRAETEAVRRTK